MEGQPNRSGSIPPPGAGASSFGASVSPSNQVMPGESEKVADPGGVSSTQSANSLALTVIGLSFLVSGAWGGYVLIEWAPGSENRGGVSGSGSSGVETGAGFGLWWLIGAVFIAVSFYAGWRILQRDERGRGIGILLALLGLFYGLVSLAAAPSPLTLALMAIDASIIWVLWTSTAFVRR